MTFAAPWFLFFIPLVVFLVLIFRKKQGLKFSSVKLLKHIGSGRSVKDRIGKALILSGLVLSLIALARPQTVEPLDFFRQQGVDIAMLLDVSGSMQSVDFEPNRLEVARDTIAAFVAGRISDRIALVIFAGTAFTRIPLTLDHGVVKESLAGVTAESVNQDGTAIGMAISVGLTRLEKSDSPSRIMILVTDGGNNAGAIDPITASNLAKDLGIKIYTIGIGSDELIMPVEVFGTVQYQRYPGGFDEALLMRIAETTGGRYFHAADEAALAQVFATIDDLEKTEFDDDGFREYKEWAFPFIAAALLLLVAGVVLDRYIFIQVP